MEDDDFTVSNFTANLKLAASYHVSISAMCRTLGINRQQFMRYLSGGSFPSRHNLRRICDFLGLDEYEILMPHDQFRKIVRLRPNPEAEKLILPPRLHTLLAEAQRQRDQLSKKLGYYYEYYYSFTKPDHVLRALIVIYSWRDYTFYKRLERLKLPGATTPPDVYKYSGMMSIVGDRLHMIDQETITGNELTQTILYPSYRNRVTHLVGLAIGVSGANAHQPSATRVILEYVGRSVDLRPAIDGCRLYHESSPDLPKLVVDYLRGGDDAEVSRLLRAEVL